MASDDYASDENGAEYDDEINDDDAELLDGRFFWMILLMIIKQ